MPHAFPAVLPVCCGLPTADRVPGVMRFARTGAADCSHHVLSSFPRLADMGDILWPAEARRNWTDYDTIPQPSCAWLTPEQELETATECCLWHHPECTAANGTNVCREAEHCVQSEWGASGAGLRHCVNCCTDVFG